MNKIAIGTAQFGMNYGIANKLGQVNRQDARAILDLARQSGLDMLDTAIAYGESEYCLGEIGVNDFKIVTKIPTIPENLPNVRQWILSHFEQSLKRLRLNSAYGLLLHTPQQLIGPIGPSIFSTLMELKSSGCVERIGVSIYSPTELESLLKNYAIDLVQTPLNIVDRRLQTTGWLSKLKSLGIEVHTRSVFLQGLLLMQRDAIPSKFSRWSYLWDAWQTSLLQRNTTALAACLSYPLSLPEIDRIVIGVDSSCQLQTLLTEVATLAAKHDWSFMACDDEDLVNPSNWNIL
jgi:aryl-alcohol dehydrogenase-like predicted oxidoreductase